MANNPELANDSFLSPSFRMIFTLNDDAFVEITHQLLHRLRDILLEIRRIAPQSFENPNNPLTTSGPVTLIEGADPRSIRVVWTQILASFEFFGLTAEAEERAAQLLISIGDDEDPEDDELLAKLRQLAERVSPPPGYAENTPSPPPTNAGAEGHYPMKLTDALKIAREQYKLVRWFKTKAPRLASRSQEALEIGSLWHIEQFINSAVQADRLARLRATNLSILLSLQDSTGEQLQEYEVDWFGAEAPLAEREEGLLIQAQIEYEGWLEALDACPRLRYWLDKNCDLNLA
ncbi:MAG: hypothetical protein ACRYGG_22655 [Janthinobacterium lividum]